MSEVKINHNLSDRHVLQIVQGDITQEQVDAIVNAANEHLAHGGGVAAAIVRKGGRIIQEESNQWVRQHGPVNHDSPAYTSAGNLPCRYVIHAVGPRWGQGHEDQKLADAINGSLEVARQLSLQSIALPAISTGIFGFPVERAAKIFFETIGSFAEKNTDSGPFIIRITLYDQPTLDSFLKVFSDWRNLA